MKRIEGSITTPKGFLAGAVKAGIKPSGKLDLALIYSEVLAVVAGTFTGNQVKAAPIIVSQKQIKSGLCQAIIANAGNANCHTGKQGLKDATAMVSETAAALKIKPVHVLVASTGSIGHTLPMNKVIPGIRKVAGEISTAGGESVAQAILTTDLKKKEVVVKVGGYTIAGIAKGSGMIHPNMATMFAFITTDAQIDRVTLQPLLGLAVNKSFNAISVDQCQSTNDCVFVLANGCSGVAVKGQKEKKDFAEALDYVCTHLAKEIARDGEGATQLVEVRVSGARNKAEALIAARAIACSDLLKCAVYGRDYNLGRVFAAAGASTAKINMDKITGHLEFGKGETVVTCNLGVGKGVATAWGCDLTERYITINAEYHT